MKGVTELETITIGKITFVVATKSGKEVIQELAIRKRISVCDFKNGPGWRVEPLTDSTRIPSEAKVLMQEINETGIEVRWWVAHEVQPNIKEDSPGVDAAAKVVRW